MPGRGTIGIEVPNEKPDIVSFKSVIKTSAFQETKMELPIALGKTISNEAYVFDLAKMPHLLVAGATGQGKSVGLNAMIASLLYKKHPSELKFVLVDPKKVELTLYEKLENHFIATLPDAKEPIITDNHEVIHVLSSLNVEMDNRYQLLKAANVRTIIEYNKKFTSRQLNPEKGHKYLPYIVLVIDEFADLIMTAGKEIELPIARLAQLARAIGIHLIVATQRPSTNIITGTIKANFPARIAFRVASMIDSRTILDSPGANRLIGRGDMLITQGGSDMIRLQCAFIDTPELERLTKYISEQQAYPMPFLLPEPLIETDNENEIFDLDKRDELFDEAAKIIVMNQQGSTSLIQRKLSIGYNRAGRIIDQMEAAGIVGPSKGSKARDVYINDEYSLEKLLGSLP
jgi:S-DNA-T family DNA segregation ATPase FtsK/SpoIIIE